MAQQLWAGVDPGKSDHYCVVIDADGKRLLSQRVANDETVLLELIAAVTTLADGGEVTWAIDLNGGGAALLISLLMAAEQRVLYIPGRTLYFEAESEDDLRKVGYSNYAEVAVMPRSCWLGWCSCWSASLAAVARAA